MSSLPPPGRAPKDRAIAVPMGGGIVANRMDPALSQRVWSIGGGDSKRVGHLFLVAHGRADFRTDDGGDVTLSAPALVWLPRSFRGDFILPAGCDGAMLAVAEDLVWRAVGDSPVVQHLRSLLDRIAIGLPGRVAPYLSELSGIMAVILRETRDQSPGGSTMASLNLGLLFLHLWRLSGEPATTTQRGGGPDTFQLFLQLVEIHYRESLSIDDFAALLGSSRAHLHESCLKATGMTPLALVHKRLISEAKLRLQQTRLSVEQVGYGLGFPDPGYFNRFFKRLTGQSPGVYRQTTRKAASGDTSSFAAWP